MKLMRVGPVGREIPAGLDDRGRVCDLSPVLADVDGALLGDLVALHRVRLALSGRRLDAVPPATRIAAPLARPGKIVGIGHNYGGERAERPVVFLKPASTMVGPYDVIEMPDGSSTTDYEVELGVVVGARLRRCHDRATALRAVGGYVAVNDVTERTLAMDGPTWAKGKCCDTFTPVGPWLVTPDEVPDPQGLTLRLLVNGQVRQEDSTRSMLFQVADILCYLSTLMTLEPGDLVLTGTPGGVAAGMPEPKPFLRNGDVVELEISGLGSQRTPVRS
jgi:2-keto-4-pentenoate hydratase/2-oxohepta-3-ene-1,7-dioic acid hydratase in catechol pathway